MAAGAGETALFWNGNHALKAWRRNIIIDRLAIIPPDRQ